MESLTRLYIAAYEAPVRLGTRNMESPHGAPWAWCLPARAHIRTRGKVVSEGRKPSFAFGIPGSKDIFFFF